MVAWVIVAIGGGVLGLIGLLRAYRQFQAGKLGIVSLIAYVVGFTSVAVYALLSAFRPEVMTSAVTLLTLLPAITAVAVIAHYHGKTLKHGEAGT